MEFLDDIKMIWGYMKEYKKTVIGTVVLALFLAVFEGFVPYLYGRLVDLASNNSATFLIFSLLGVWVLTSLLSVIFRRAVSLRGEFIAIDVLGKSIQDHASHIANLPLSFHREKNVGETVSMIIRASDHLKGIIGDTVFWVAPRFLTVIIGITIMFFINWQLAVGTIIVFVVSASMALSRSQLIISNQKLLNKKLDQSAGLLNDSFLNIHTIKSSGSEEFQKSKIKEIYQKEINPTYKKTTIDWENTEVLQEGTFSLGFVALFGYAVFLLSKGIISQGTLVMFLGYLDLTRMPLRFLLWQWLSVQRGLTAIKRMRSLLKLETENYNEGGEDIKDPQGKVEYKNIYFGYEGKGMVLKDINFTARPGQKIALVGGSGEGKTTTVDLLSLYFTPDKGKILLDDVNIKKLKLKFLRSIIAYVPQEIILFNDTIKNNILYGKPEATEEEIVKAAKAANIHNYIEKLPKKYNTLVGERGIKVSTGQKQRLAIARAIIRNPKILVLDEATSSLDVKSEKLIQEALERLEKNKTTFIIAHRLSTVRKADKILVLEGGKIIEQGNHEELMKKQGAYFKFYNLQFSPQDIIQ
ncbi:ABC transporter ATP-binding protein/permease [Patescibacteria group bacterium]|nr:ABC transporter ATP-binding protein/permease [Patescibacteria group bacterium]